MTGQRASLDRGGIIEPIHLLRVATVLEVAHTRLGKHLGSLGRAQWAVLPRGEGTCQGIITPCRAEPSLAADLVERDHCCVCELRVARQEPLAARVHLAGKDCQGMGHGNGAGRLPPLRSALAAPSLSFSMDDS